MNTRRFYSEQALHFLPFLYITAGLPQGLEKNTWILRLKKKKSAPSLNTTLGWEPPKSWIKCSVSFICTFPSVLITSPSRESEYTTVCCSVRVRKGLINTEDRSQLPYITPCPYALECEGASFLWPSAAHDFSCLLLLVPCMTPPFLSSLLRELHPKHSPMLIWPNTLDIGRGACHVQSRKGHARTAFSMLRSYQH